MTVPLSLNNITMTFGKTNVLKDLSLELTAGSVTGLLGKNGSGKTTLMRIALGLLKPNTGTANLFDTAAWNAAPSNRLRIGYVPQGEVPFGWMKVKDALNMVSNYYTEWDAALVNRYLNDWQLPEDSYIEDLSQGQAQKVAILFAMGHRPELLLLDEPVASLDPGARRQFLSALVELNHNQDRTILFSTHIISDVERVAADIAVLNQQGIAYHGDVDRLKENCARLILKGENLPDKVAEPDIQRYQRDSTTATAFARNWNPVRTKQLSEELGASVHAESLPLEELFMEMTND